MTAPVPRSGQVVDAVGAPVPGAFVVVVDGPVPVPEIALKADAGGRFTVALPPGRWTLRAHGPSGTGETVWTVPAGPADPAVEPEPVITLSG